MQKLLLIPYVRQGLYIGGAFLLILFIHAISRELQQTTFDEGHCIENFQVALLAVSTAVFAAIAWKYGDYRVLSWGFASLCACGICREFDSVLSAALPVASWKIGFLAIALATANAWRQRAKCVSELRTFGHTTAFAMMCFSAVLVIPVAQMVGHNPFLRAALPEFAHVNRIKELVEETLETFGYFAVLCSSAELLAVCVKCRMQKGE